MSQPHFGTLTWDIEGNFRYAPGANFPGTDSFTFTLFDGAAQSNTATIWLEAPAAPVARPDSYSVAHAQKNPVW